MHFQKYFPRKGLTKLENHRKSDLIGDPAGADRPADRVCKGCARRCLFVLSGLLPRGAGRGLLGLRAGAHRAVGGAGGRAGAVVFYTLIRVFTKRRSLLRWLAGVLLGVSAGLFAFVGLWGLNHFGPSVGQTLGLDVREYSKQELIAATAYYAAQANEYAARVDRDADGKTVYPAFSELVAQAPAGYAALAERYEQFTGALDPVKPLASWRLFSQTGTTGIFVCFTAEACVNPDTYTAWIPYTMCHELAHRQAVAAEDDANFCAYLACMASGSDDFAIPAPSARMSTATTPSPGSTRPPPARSGRRCPTASSPTCARRTSIMLSTRARCRTRRRRSTIPISRPFRGIRRPELRRSRRSADRVVSRK